MVDVMHRYKVLRVKNATNEKLACIVLIIHFKAGQDEAKSFVLID